MFVNYSKRHQGVRGGILPCQHVYIVRAVNVLDAKAQAKTLCKAEHPKAYRVGPAGVLR